MTIIVNLYDYCYLVSTLLKDFDRYCIEVMMH